MARGVQTWEASGAVAHGSAMPALPLGDRFGTQLNEMTQDLGVLLPPSKLVSVATIASLFRTSIVAKKCNGRSMKRQVRTMRILGQHVDVWCEATDGFGDCPRLDLLDEGAGKLAPVAHDRDCVRSLGIDEGFIRHRFGFIRCPGT